MHISNELFIHSTFHSKDININRLITDFVYQFQSLIPEWNAQPLYNRQVYLDH